MHIISITKILKSHHINFKIRVGLNSSQNHIEGTDPKARK